MCGIFAAIDLPRPTRTREDAILRALASRGCDDQGRWRDDRALFLHTRLAIQDLSRAGRQPMTSGEGEPQAVIIFNGEIYNQHELRRELAAAGHRFTSTSDTEVLLAGFRFWGREVWRRLEGIYAAAVWEPSAGRLTLARDPLGVKPLLWWRQGGRCAAASSLSGLEASGLASRGQLDTRALRSYALWGSVASPLSILKGVEAFPPGHWAEWTSDGSWRVERWSAPFGTTASTTGSEGVEAIDVEDAATGVEGALRAAVEAQCIGDVPIGIFLSGGLDSGLLAALVRQIRNGPIPSLSLGFRDLPGAVDESVSARLSASHLGLEHHPIEIGLQDLDESFDSFLDAIGQPSIDGFNGFLVARAAKALGIKVALSGLGADELFAGYPHLWSPSLLDQLRAREIQSHGLSAAHVEELHGERRALVPNLQEGISSIQARLLELRGYLRDTLLRDTDAVSMQHGVEVRVPFLHLPLVQKALSIDGAIHLADGPKTLLRRIAQPLLPRETIAGKKRGFSLPLGTWIASSSRFHPDRIVALLAGHEIPSRALRASWALLRARPTHWQYYWRWVVLAEWLQRGAGAR